MVDKMTQDIADALKDVRQTKKMTQVQVAKKAGISDKYYAKLEQALSTPSLKMLKKIVTALNAHSSDVLPF